MKTRKDFDTTVYYWNWASTQKEVLFKLEPSLSRSEQATGQGFLSEKRRLEFITGRCLLRWVFKTQLDIELPDELPLGPNDKPLPIQNWNFNLSHSHLMTVLGVSDGHKIGVDIEYEKVRKMTPKILEVVASGEEMKHFQSLNSAAKQAFFYQLWTQKEACGKATGRGLQDDLKNFTIIQHTDQPATKVLLETTRINSHWLSVCRIDAANGQKVIWKKIVLDSEESLQIEQAASSLNTEKFQTHLPED